jgi:methyl-accepting chemotaxis protein
MLQNLKVGPRLALGFALVLALLVGAVALSAWQMEVMDRHTVRIVQVYAAELDASRTMQVQVQTIQRQLRTILLTGDDQRLAQVSEGLRVSVGQFRL